MSTVVLNAAPKAITTRIATIESGNYVFVGFHKHIMKIKKDGIANDVPTYAPVLAKLDANNTPIGLYQVNRSDLIRLENPRIEWQKPTKIYNNTGTFVDELTGIVTRVGYFADALWMNKALSQFRNTVLQVKTTQFAGISSTGSIWRGAKVYDINKTTTVFNQHGELGSLITAKGWLAEDCVGFNDTTPVTFQYKDKDGNIVNVTNVDADGKLL